LRERGSVLPSGGIISLELKMPSSQDLKAATPSAPINNCRYDNNRAKGVLICNELM
jgi:hypothetical protein